MATTGRSRVFVLRGWEVAAIMLCVARELVGRADEWAAVRTVLERARQDPTTLVLDGAAGIGKTTGLVKITV